MLRNRRLLWALAGLAAAEACFILAWYAVERTRLRAVEHGVTYAKGEGPYLWRFENSGIARPSTRPAAAAGLGGDEEVIGVVVGGEARAYWLKALRYPPQHLINDELGESPVSVAYCDLSDCTRAYTKPGATGPLELATVGLLDGKMVIKVGGVRYYHQTGDAVEPVPGAPAFPYQPLPWTRTTWRDWKTLHPTTDVYVGEHDAPAMPTSP
jgi:hypothetical protein